MFKLIIGACALLTISAIIISKKKKSKHQQEIKRPIEPIKPKKQIQETKQPIEPIKTESQIKGEIGENITTAEFQRFFNSVLAEYKILRNIYLKFNNGNTTEIDILIISEYGIFVVENKNYCGLIFGSFKDEKWTNCHPNGEKYKFYNPLKQNYTHIKAIKNYINSKHHNKIYSYIVFNQECELKKVPYNSEFIKIIQDYEIYETLSENINDKCLTAAEVEELYNTLIEFTNVSNEVKEMHIKGINFYSKVVKN